MDLKYNGVAVVACERQRYHQVPTDPIFLRLRNTVFCKHSVTSSVEEVLLYNFVFGVFLISCIDICFD